MAAYRRVDDLRSLVGWLPVHQDRLQAQCSVSGMGKPLPLPFTLYLKQGRIMACASHTVGYFDEESLQAVKLFGTKNGLKH